MSSVAYSVDSKTIVSAVWYNVLQWDAATCKQRGPTLHIDAGLGLLSSVAISPDGGTVAATDVDSLLLWDALSGALRARLKSEERLSRVAFSPDGKMVASGSNDGSIRLWDAASGQPVGVPVHVSEATLTSLAFSPNGKSIASGSEDGTVRVSDAPNGWIDRVCAKVVRNLSEAEWSRYVGDIAYVKQCPELPVPMD
jgi:WD40 repeat protein